MATRDTRIWICPALCGCELRIHAEWVDPTATQEDNRLVSHRHPIPGTVRSVEIQSVCTAHDALRTAALPEDPYFGSPGYLRIPAGQRTQWEAALTEAERLYVHLFRYSAQRNRPDTCGCRICEVHDRSGQEGLRRVQHRQHTRKCRSHEDDDDQHTNALENAARKNRLLNRLKNQFPSVTDDNVTWEFQRTPQGRVFHINPTSLTPAQKASVQNWADTNVGAGRVVVE